MRTLYLNNNGSKWRNFPDAFLNEEKETITLETKAGKKITRVIIYWEQWGNWACALISYKGKKISVFPDSALED